MKNSFTFLICSERSGSNLIVKIFNSHPEFCGPSPTHLLRNFIPILARYKNNDEKLINDVFQVFNSKLSFWNTNVSIRELSGLKNKKLSDLYQYIYTKEAEFENKRRVFIKENHAYNFIPYILLSYPESKFITLVRDPRDMALSWKNAKALKGSIIRAVDIWVLDQSMAINAYNNLGIFNKNYLLRYEDLITNPENELKKCCSFLDCDYNEQMLEFFKSGTSVKNSEMAVDWQNISRSLLTNNYNKYKNDLTDDEIKYIEYKCDIYMDTLNYRKEFNKIYDSEFYKIENKLRKKENDKIVKYEKEVSEEERNKRRMVQEVLGKIKNAEAMV